MNDSVVYNIPFALVEAYRGRNVIVRSRDPAALVQRLATYALDRVAALQILGAGSPVDDLLRWEEPVPVDLLVDDPQVDLPHLYRYSPLLADRPVRVSVPMIAGFGKVVKLALSLNFAVKLESSQPEPEPAETVRQVADLYLHQSTISQPVEYIHSVFMAFYHGAAISLWALQEEDPFHDRFVTNGGVEILLFQDMEELAAESPDSDLKAKK